MFAACAAFLITACAPPTLQEEPQDEMILVQSWLEYDAVDGRLIGYSSRGERVALEDVRTTVLERATSEHGPDAIHLCEAKSAEGTDGKNCELVFFTKDWQQSEPLRQEAYGNTI